jgi:hypothetical protein
LQNNTFEETSSNPMTDEEYVLYGKRTAIISFVVGTIIFVLHFFTSANILLLAGFIFIGVAALVNMILMFKISVRLTQDKTNIKQLNKVCKLMLVNIPVMLLYCWITIMLEDIARITFTNSTQTELTNIKIGGCEEKQIDKLEAGESTTVWIDVPGDCLIYINYLSRGQKKEKTVVGYATGGIKLQHNIDGENDN